VEGMSEAPTQSAKTICRAGHNRIVLVQIPVYKIAIGAIPYGRSISWLNMTPFALAARDGGVFLQSFIYQTGGYMELLNDASAYLESNSGVVLLSISIVVVLALILLLVIAIRFNSFTKPLKNIRRKSSSDELLAGILKAVENNTAEIQKLTSGLSSLSQRSRAFLQRSAVIRYDAFEDIGGKQSFSLCLLDDLKNGFLLTYLTGRNSARSYAVEITNGQASRKLSEEEKQALDEALSGRKLSPVSAG
jgi:hypothetical protein